MFTKLWFFAIKSSHEKVDCLEITKNLLESRNQKDHNYLFIPIKNNF